MATVPCPGCGLPRTEAEIGTKPCPVCDVVLAPAPDVPPAEKPVGPDPTTGLPADSSELYAPNAPAPPRAHEHVPEIGRRLMSVGAVTFVLGVLCGAGGVLAFQAINRPKPKLGELAVAAEPNDGNAPNGQPAALCVPAVAPVPHEPGPFTVVEPDSDSNSRPDPDFKLALPPPPGRPVLIELNQPEDDYHVPFPMNKGEHVVLKGRVKKFHVTGLDAGSVLDASGLEASIITVTGKIDGHSTLKLKAPNGTVHISAKVDGQSIVGIDAPGGEVRFMLTTTPMRKGSKIDGGSTVSVTARSVEFRGDITGTDTKVSATLTRGGTLDVEAVRGRALVEYKPQVAEWAPVVRIGSVAATATVRKID